MSLSSGEKLVVVAAIYNVGHTLYFCWSFYDFLGALLIGLALDVAFYSVWLFEHWICYLHSELALWTAERNSKRENLLQQESLGRYRRQRRMLLQQ